MNSSVSYEAPPLNILHLTASIGPKSGGLGTVATGFAEEQRLLGHSPAIWTLDEANIVGNVAQLAGIDPAMLSTFPGWGPRQFGYSPQMEQAIASMKGASYDLLHQHGIWLVLSHATNRWRSVFRHPTVVAPHGTLEEYTLRISRWKKKLALLAYEMKNLRSATCLHATSSQEALSFRRFGLENPVAVIPNGIPEDWLRSEGNATRFRVRYSIPSNKRLLLFLSRLHPKKGLPLLFEAMAQLPGAEEWLLIIAGFEDYPNYREELTQIAEDIDVAGNIVFVGGLFGQERRDAFAAADLFVLPTHSENFALVVAESLAVGVPVLTTHGAPWEELQTHRCGWWVAVRTDAIRDALQDAIHRSPQDLQEMGHRGKALIEQKYTWPRVAKQTIVLYNWLLGKGQQPEFVIKE